MKQHLSVHLFKTIFVCLSVTCLTAGSGVAWAENQDLVFSRDTLVWDTQTEIFEDEDAAVVAFSSGDNVRFESDVVVSLCEDIIAGQLTITAGSDVYLHLGEYTLNFDTLSLQGGSLNMGTMLSISAGQTFAVGSNDAVLRADLSLADDATLQVDFSGSGAETNMNDSTLTLHGGSRLQLQNCGTGDGKTYTLLTCVSTLLDKDGNELTLDSSNNVVSLYFDTTQPGTAFWADATLHLTDDGSLQLVRHNETVKVAESIDTRQSGDSFDYSYYKSIRFADIDYSSADGSVYGGAIDGNTVTMNDNGSVTFSGILLSSSSYAYGGAISGSTTTLNGNGSVEFLGNSAYAEDYYSTARGGAIRGNTVTLNDNGSVTFNGNSASTDSILAMYSPVHGGAIYGEDSITLNGNGSVEFCNNSVASTTALANVSSDINSPVYGGAIYVSSFGANYGTITLSGNGRVTFSGNSASTFTSTSAGWGGAIYGGKITMNDNGIVTFSENSVSASTNSSVYGGAIQGNETTLSGNGSVFFCGNSASAENFAQGGAISGDVTLSDNGIVMFRGNSVSSADADALGGAISGYTVTLSGNGSVTFSGNFARTSSSNSGVYVSGGAIYAGNSTISLTCNGSVEFIGNSISSTSICYGGAVHAYGALTIAGNNEVTFARNVEKSGTDYRLRSLYLSCDGSTDKLTLSAGKGQSIRFYDSVYMGASSSVELNADYADADGVTQKARGTILFSGATTEDDLKDAKDGVAGTKTEILNSRTSEINSAATLYGGTLQVQDKAVLKLNGGLTVAEGSRAAVQVRAAELDLGGKALNMVGGSSLELTDGAKLTNTSLTIETDATLTVRGVTSTVKAETRVAALTMSKSMVEGVVSVCSANTGFVCVLDGDLTLESGSRICFDGAYLELMGDLVFDVESGAEKIALEITPGIMMDDTEPLALLSVGGTVTFSLDGLSEELSGDQVYHIKASDYFTGSMLTENSTLVYDGVNKVMYLAVADNVPEPTTTMLGLVGMVALTFRRRRKD